MEKEATDCKLSNYDWLLNNLVVDLAEFLNISMEEAYRRVEPKWYTNYYGFTKGIHDRKRWMTESSYYLYDGVRWQVFCGGFGTPNIYSEKALNKHCMCDFGAGIGSQAFWMAKNGWNHVTMVDTMTLNCEFMKFRAKKYNVNSVTIKQKLDGTERFDLVLMKDMIAYIVNPEQVVVEIVNCINDNGILCVIGWGNTNDTSEGQLRGNKEVDFHQLFLDLGLEEIQDPYGKTFYRKSSKKDDVYNGSGGKTNI